MLNVQSDVHLINITAKKASLGDSKESSARRRDEAETINTRILSGCKSTFNRDAHLAEEGAKSTSSARNKGASGEPEHLHHKLKPSAGVIFTH